MISAKSGASVWQRIIDNCIVKILCIKRTREYRTAIVVLLDMNYVSYKIWLLVLSQASKHLLSSLHYYQLIIASASADASADESADMSEDRFWKL